jgi:rhodanese-related sulfurtransferase
LDYDGAGGRPAESAAVGPRENVIFVDVRERVEREMGTLPGATILRNPDLAGSRIDLAGKKVIAFCHNGNHSYAMCEALARRSIDCNFIVGALKNG